MKWWQIKKRDAELERELRSDLELEEEDQRDRGISPQEARYAARRAFGNTTLIKEQTRETWGWAPFERVGQDVRYALRQLRRSPVFTCISLLTLSLGIGANSAVFSVIQAVLLRPLPFHDPSRLVFLADPQDPQDGGILLKDIGSLKSQSRSLEQISAHYRNSGWSRVTLTGSQEPIAIQGAFVSADLFPLLGIAPQLGRNFTGEEEARHDDVTVLSYGLWQRRFGGSPDVIGQTMQLDGVVSNGTKGDGEKSEPRHLCPGTPVTFTQYDFVGQTQYDFTIPDFRLPSYQPDMGFPTGSMSFDITTQR